MGFTEQMLEVCHVHLLNNRRV